MKNCKLIMVTMATLSGTPLFSQFCGQHLTPPGVCLDTVPAEAIVISADMTIGGTGSQCYWICEGVTLTIGTIESGNLNFDMEANSTLNFTGNESTIWAKEGCTINIGACFPIIRINMEEDVDVNFDGGGAACIVMDTCENINFDYSEAPSSGCAVAIENVSTHDVFSIFPNPTKNELAIHIYTAGFSETAFILRDMQGRIVYEQLILYAGEETIPVHLPELTAGIYTVSFAGNTKLLVME